MEPFWSTLGAILEQYYYILYTVYRIPYAFPRKVKKMFNSLDCLEFLENKGPFISDGRPLFDALKLRGLFMWAPGVCVPDLLYLWSI